ncbi:MAG: hypothetical protein ACI9BW_002820 [Gammaproteobacteria bacterium]|jgi:hypothetical protein
MTTSGFKNIFMVFQGDASDRKRNKSVKASETTLCERCPLFVERIEGNGFVGLLGV